MPINIYQKLGPRVNREFFNKIKDIIFDSGNKWVVFRNKAVKAPGFYSSKRIRLSRGRIIVTKSRFICVVGNYKLIDVPLNLTKKIIDKSNPKRFIINLKLEDFSKLIKGEISLSFFINPNIIKI